ncbi:MAG: cation-translocating P-type ATPase [Fimbriimonadaceae bacterium]|nr:MAG: cation-translocating P-type ATPase [Fimbriimonadaceae bacterium]
MSDNQSTNSIKSVLTDWQSLLTIICGATLVLAMFPQLHWVGYISCAAGSVFALKSARDSLAKRELDVNLLMILAAIGAIVVGQVVDAAALLFLFSLSSSLESFAMAKTKSAIASLVQLRPKQARLVKDGIERLVAVEDLKIGDIIRVNGFEGVPADGEIVEGSTSINESALTGEAEPVSKHIGDAVTGGTQNLEGMVLVRVGKLVSNSMLNQIVKLVEEAQENKASGERISLWFGQRYTIFVLLAFFVSWGVRLLIGQNGSDAFYSSLILLVGLSPCALVISTPAATLSALANAARKGILVRGGEFIERAATVDIVTMDKTGTLTKGQPQLVEVSVWIGEIRVDWLPGQAVPQEILPVLTQVAAVENTSSHPLAQAVVTAASQAGVVIPPTESSRTVPGMGMVAQVDGESVAVGNDKLMVAENHAVPADMEQFSLALKKEGKTTVLASGAEFRAVFAFEDEIRQEAKQVVEDLRHLGVGKVMMLTGDKPETANSIAEHVGLTSVHAALMPADKTRIVQELSHTGQVMMVGDGVNDAPSLAAASIGVAMGGLGSDVALEAADVVLSHDRLDRIPQLISLGRRTQGIIRANLVFAGGVIVVLAVSSFLVNLPLPVAVIGHEGSTVLVILNGLRLLRD